MIEKILDFICMVFLNFVISLFATFLLSFVFGLAVLPLFSVFGQPTLDTVILFFSSEGLGPKIIWLVVFILFMLEDCKVFEKFKKKVSA